MHEGRLKKPFPGILQARPVRTLQAFSVLRSNPASRPDESSEGTPLFMEIGTDCQVCTTSLLRAKGPPSQTASSAHLNKNRPNPSSTYILPSRISSSAIIEARLVVPSKWG